MDYFTSLYQGLSCPSHLSSKALGTRLWKYTVVVPHLKEGDHEDARNIQYHALSQSASKICERIALNQFMNYLDANDLLTNHQSGNKKYNSTETLNIHVTDFILKAMDKKQMTVLVLLDLSKAYDSINHDLLLGKLRSLGVSPSALRWFYSYLTGRRQAVRIGSTLSSKLPIKNGVPQGSILGPILFSLYINDLPTVSQHCNIESYVDDSKLFLAFSLNELDDAVTKVNQDLTLTFEWCCTNYLLINPTKTKVMVFGVPQLVSKLPQDITFTLMDKQLTISSNAKDLGVTLDPYLNYNDHVANVVSSCMRALVQINRVRHLFKREILIKIINCLVFSKLYYCSSVWASTSETNIGKLQCVQNFAARIVTGTKKFEHITPILKDLKTPEVAAGCNETLY